MKKMLILLIVGVFASAGFGAFTEDFDDFQLGALVAQYSWEAHASVTVETTSSSGEYTGGRSLRANASGDEWPRHDSTGVDLGLTLDQGGIEYGFDVKEDVGGTSVFVAKMFMREGRTANYGPVVGFTDGEFTIRPEGTSGDTILGNWIGNAGGDGSDWDKGDWLRVWIQLTGTDFSIASVYCYNLTKGVAIDTGLKNVDTGVNIASKAASWTGFNFRFTKSTNTYVDNAYIKDITPSTYLEDFESLSLGSINQAGWRDNAPNVEVVDTSTSGEYAGSQALQSNVSWADQWPQYEQTRSEDFGLNIGAFDGVECGFDFKETSSSSNLRVHFREGVTGNYGPAFGLDSGSFAVRPVGEQGETITGNPISDAETAGTWEDGDWVRLRMILRGDSYNYATLYAYNLTKGVDISTGIVNVNIGTNPQANAGDWSRLTIRLGGPTDTQVDNIYIGDFVDDDVLAKFPDPADGEYPVMVDGTVTLSWLGALSAESHKVYFGTSPETLTLETETTDEFYDLPYSLDKSSTYYWRVDEVIGGVEYEGIVWSFDTELEPLGYPRRMAYEGFDYEPYQELSSGGDAAGGFGWSTAWEREEGDWCYLNSGEGSLQPAMDYLLGTTGNKIQHISGGVDEGGMRELEYPIDARVDQDYYISYLAMGDNDTYNNVGIKLFEEKNGALLFGSNMYYQGYNCEQGFCVESPQFSLRTDAGNWWNRVFGSWSSGEVYVFVIKISASAAGDDTVYMSVFSQSNPLPIEEPTTWDESFTTQSNKVYPWIEINGRADEYDQWHFDELHIGTGWGAVTGWAEACGDAGTIMEYDFNEDCYVGFEDYAVMASDWLKCTDPALDGCEWVIDENDPNFTTLFTDLPEEQLDVYETEGVTVDGDLSEWDGSRWYNTRFEGTHQVEYAADVTEAELAMKYDPASSDKVYLAVKVKDTSQSFTSDPNAWFDGDNIEVRFSLNDTSTDESWRDNSTFDVAQYYHIFPLSGGSSQAYLGSVGLDPQQDAGVYTDMVYAVSTEGDYIYYELALPAYSSYDINTQSGTLSSLADGDVIAFNFQINSSDGTSGGAGGLFTDHSNVPDEWYKFTVTADSSLVLGDLGFFDADLDENGVVGLSDLDVIIQKWLSCTDPEGTGCDEPWLP